MEKITRAEAIELLEQQSVRLKEVSSWSTAKLILEDTGKLVGYKPVFRCLVLDVPAEKAIQWKEELP